MSLKYILIRKIRATFGFGNKVKEKSFFEFSSEEKKKIIREAASGANKMQSELEQEYDKKFPQLNPAYTKSESV